VGARWSASRSGAALCRRKDARGVLRAVTRLPLSEALHVRWVIAALCGLGRAALCSSLTVDPGLPQLRPAGRSPLAL
jgi:hypothetical protein